MLAVQEERQEERHIVDAVEALRGGCANEEQCTTDTTAALTWAAAKGHSDIVEQLLRLRANVNQGRIKNGVTALMYAAANGSAGTAEVLLRSRANVDQGTTDTGTTALMLAAFKGNISTVEVLLRAQSNTNQCTTDNGSTAVMWAVAKGHTVIVEVLLRARANVNQGRINNGATALMLAAQENHIATVKVLLEARANVNQRTTNNDRTALTVSSARGYADVVMLLLAVGCAKVDNQVLEVVPEQNALRVQVLWLCFPDDHTFSLTTAQVRAYGLGRAESLARMVDMFLHLEQQQLLGDLSEACSVMRSCIVVSGLCKLVYEYMRSSHLDALARIQAGLMQL
jgi:ankyrin repeat protein